MNRAEYVRDPNLLKQATSEYALTAVNQVLHLVSEKDQSIQVIIGTLTELIVDADGIFDDEVRILIAAQKKNDRLHYDGERMLDNLVKSYVEGICTLAKETSETSVAVKNDDGNIDAMEEKKKYVAASPAPQKGKRKSEAVDIMETPTLSKRANKINNDDTSQANRSGTPNLHKRPYANKAMDTLNQEMKKKKEKGTDI